MRRRKEPPKPWTDEEREILKTSYPTFSLKEILELFGDTRSWIECILEAERLGIKRLVRNFEKNPGPRGFKRKDRDSRSLFWTDEDRKKLKRLYPKAPKQEVLDALPGRTWHSIQKEASRLKIARKGYERAKRSGKKNTTSDQG